MKKILFVFLLAAVATAGIAQDLQSKLDSIMNTYNRLSKFNGNVLVAKDGNILLQKSYGFRDAENKIANDANTIFQIGSLTKQFTTAILLKLQEQNKLSIKDKLSKYIPDFPKGDSITIEQLASHTAGVYNYTNQSAFMATEASKPIERLKLIGLFKNKPLDFQPGSRWSYSNSGYILLGYIIEKVTGKPYEKVVREMIFEPLGMTRSGFDFANLKDNDKAIGYNVLNEDMIIPAAIVDSSVAFAAGAIYTTTGDLYKWHRGLATNKILSKESQQLAFRPIKNFYGLGWFVDSFDHKLEQSHGGGIFGFVSYINRIPEDDVVIILFNNTGGNDLQSISNNLRAALYGKPFTLPQERKQVKLAESVLKEYEGTYDLAPNFSLKMTVENGKLMGEATGQPKVEMFAEKQDHFFLKIVDAQITFVRGNDGKVISLVLHQGGQNIPGKKVQ